MTDDAAHYIFFSTLAICGTVLALVFLAIRARARRRIPQPVARGAAYAQTALAYRRGFKPRVAFSVVGFVAMIAELGLPVIGEIVDVGIAAVLAYAWYTFFRQPRMLGGQPLRRLPAGVDECVRCHGSGFTDGAIDPLCGGRGWVSAPNQPVA